MSIFTVVIIIWGIYQLVVSITKKKGMLPAPGKFPDLFTPDIRSMRDVIQGISRGTWREQLKQVMENGSYQVRSLESPEPKASGETISYLEMEGTQGTEGTQGIEGTEGTEGTQGIEGTQGTEGTSDYVGILGTEAYKSIDETPREEMARKPLGLNGLQLVLTERELVQGLMWAEILGRPRALRQFRGPRANRN